MCASYLKLLLADDDADDCIFFEDALKELPFGCSLKTVSDGEQLMRLLKTNQNSLPDILFLDLNMPRKNGYECLLEIKGNEKLKKLSVIIYSTSLNCEVVNKLYEKGAQHYIRKPGDFAKLKRTILEAITVTTQGNRSAPARENFIIQV